MIISNIDGNDDDNDDDTFQLFDITKTSFNLSNIKPRWWIILTEILTINTMKYKRKVWVN